MKKSKAGAANVAENSVRLYGHKKYIPTDYNTA